MPDCLVCYAKYETPSTDIEEKAVCYRCIVRKIMDIKKESQVRTIDYLNVQSKRDFCELMQQEDVESESGICDLCDSVCSVLSISLCEDHSFL